MEDLLQSAVAIVFDWLRPHPEDGRVSRRALWMRWTIAFLVAAAIVVFAVWLTLAVGGL